MLAAHEEVVGRVSLVLRPLDTVTGREGEAELSVRLGAKGPPAIRTPSGFYAFEDVAPHVHAVHVRAVGAHRGRYVDARLELDLAAQTPPLVLALELWPAPDYPFPPRTTLVRGRVETLAGTPVAQAEIGLDPPGPRAFSDANGDFVLALAPTSPAAVLLVASKGSAVDSKSVSVVAGGSASAGTLQLDVP